MAHPPVNPRRSQYRRRRPIRRSPSISAKKSEEAVTEPPAVDWSIIEPAVKVLAGLTLGLYVLGLLAINGYLFHLGTSDFSLVRPRFVYTGALIVTFFSMAFIPLLFTLHRWRLNMPRRETGMGTAIVLGRISYVRKLLWHSIDIALTLLTPLFFYSVALLIFGRQDKDGSFDWAFLKSAVSMYLLGLFVTFLFVNIWRMMDTTSRNLRGTYRLYNLVGWYVNFLLWAVVYVTIFMIIIFPTVPDQFGGGRPKEVRLVLKQEAAEGASEVGILRTSKEQITESLDLIYEGSDKYVVRLSNDRIVTVDKQAVLFVQTGA